MPEQPSEVSLIEYLANPQHWPNGAYLELWRKYEVLPGSERVEEKGVLIAPIMGRYIFYPGIDIHSPASEMEKARQNSKMMLAYQLQDLIDEGWVID